MAMQNFADGAQYYNAPNRSKQRYVVSRHSLLHSIPWPIVGHQFVLGALVRRLGYFVDGEAFFNRLAIEVRLASARGDDRAALVPAGDLEGTDDRHEARTSYAGERRGLRI